MKISRNYLIDIVNIIASLIMRNVLFIIILLLIMLTIIFNNLQPSYIYNIKNNMMNMVTPIHKTMSNTTLFIKNIPDNISSFLFTYRENIELKNKISELSNLQNTNIILEAENKELKKNVDFFATKRKEDIIAKIIGSYNINSQDVIIVSAGSNQGVQLNQPVINQYGLVGRIFEVYESSAKILVVTNNQSKISVIFNNSRKYAILAGAGRKCFSINYLDDLTGIEENELVLTSGDGGVMPQGIIVGKVTFNNGQICIKPVFQDDHSEFVIIKNR